MNQLNRELRRWEKIYNTVRPHQALGSLHPAAVPATNLISTEGMKSVTYLLDEYTLLPAPPAITILSEFACHLSNGWVLRRRLEYPVS